MGSLERDFYREEVVKKFHGPPEFICKTCGFAFIVQPSARHARALALAKKYTRAKYYDPDPFNTRKENTDENDR